MVGHHASDGGRALGDVEAIHFVFPRGDAAAIREMARVTKALGMRVEKIGIERENDGSFVEAVMGLDEVTESEPRAFANVISSDWLVLMPFGLRKSVEQGGNLRGECG